MAQEQVTAGELQVARPGPRGFGPIPALRNFVRRQPVGAFAGGVLLVLIVLALLSPWIQPYAPDEIPADGVSLSGPTWDHPFGTDQYGRDVLSRALNGARVSLYVGILGSLGSAALAALIGMMAALWRGWVDGLIVRVVDVVQSVPAIILLVAVLSTVGTGLNTVVIVLAVRGGFLIARVIRGAALSIVQEPYMEASVAIGCSRTRSMLRHLLPNIMPVLLVMISVYAAFNIVIEASLSFLGFGVQAPNTSWGAMIGRDVWPYMVSSPYLLIVPTTLLVVTVLAINIFGDALRDHLDPRLRGV